MLPRTEGGLRQALKFCGYEVRLNIRDGAIEWKRTGDTEWNQYDPLIPSVMREDIATKVFNKTKERRRIWKLSNSEWKQFTYAVAADTQADPLIADYFDRLKPKKSDLLDRWLDELFKFDSDQALVHYVARSIPLAIVERTYEPGFQIRRFPLIVGKPGIGKSKLVKFLLPPALGLNQEEFDFSWRPKERLEAIQGKAIVELSELKGLGPKTAETAKAYLTQTMDDAIRKAYRENPLKEPRRIMFIGTANPDAASLPRNDGLLVRFAAINAIQERGTLGHVEKWLGEYLDDVFASALHAYEAGDRYTDIPADLNSVAIKAMKPFIDDPEVGLRDEVESLLLKKLFRSRGSIVVPWSAIIKHTEKAGTLLDETYYLGTQGHWDT